MQISRQPRPLTKFEQGVAILWFRGEDTCQMALRWEHCSEAEVERALHRVLDQRWLFVELATLAQKK